MRGERGSAGSVLLAAMLTVIATVLLSGVLVISWFGAVRSADQVAELAALAGASAAVTGEDACRAAAATAGRNGFPVHACVVRGGGSHVVVEVTVAAELEGAFPGAPRRVLRVAAAGTVGTA
ncbi:hypothetical protein [Tessaracoccus flavus]|uniref:Uncharacterized protein n=1 Tax=Tessaracoccus flavus TaxID=1610493 RepID=A0A1Q2CC12_9ACTN|nr:hypothetical protein [Tessaracoccus flavus]AQP43641.1 hypothetical protein RPIT_01435 [Tessaracoccus flavus]SDZ01604.1 helicase/secretion neighborhood TadE-like protein [Tessaracoccus flavus]